MTIFGRAAAHLAAASPPSLRSDRTRRFAVGGLLVTLVLLAIIGGVGLAFDSVRTGGNPTSAAIAAGIIDLVLKPGAVVLSIILCCFYLLSNLSPPPNRATEPSPTDESQQTDSSDEDASQTELDPGWQAQGSKRPGRTKYSFTGFDSIDEWKPRAAELRDWRNAGLSWPNVVGSYNEKYSPSISEATAKSWVKKLSDIEAPG